MLSPVSWLSFFTCYFCILYLSLLTFLIFVFASSFTFYFTSFSLLTYFYFSLFNSLSYYICFSVHHLKKLLSTCASDYPILYIIYLHPVFFLYVCASYIFLHSLFFSFSVHPFSVYSLLHILNLWFIILSLCPSSNHLFKILYTYLLYFFVFLHYISSISSIVLIFSVPGYTSINQIFLLFYLHFFDLKGQGGGGISTWFKENFTIFS